MPVKEIKKKKRDEKLSKLKDIVWSWMGKPNIKKCQFPENWSVI